MREELKEIDRRAVPWIKAWTLVLLGVTAIIVVLLLITAFEIRSD